jgi:adenosylcobinamide kinase/adenosylcobinamide-phosphate guanylyltransferase
MKCIVIGGAKSGKSQYCVNLLKERYVRPCLIVTAEAKDKEMEERIQKHRENRPSNWPVIEEPVFVSDRLKNLPSECDVALIDCLTLWVSNLLLKFSDNEVSGYIDDFINTVSSYNRNLLMVSNEVGLGIVPDNPLARKFRDITGSLNQRLVGICDEIVFVFSGVPFRITKDGNCSISFVKG